MHFTRRLLERRPPALERRPHALFLLACLGAPIAVASCSSESGVGEPRGDADAGTDSSVGEPDGAPAEPVQDAGSSFDGGPMPVACASSPCATALVTTRGASATDPAEGFCALLDDGTVACWGAGRAGQLGRGDSAGGDDSATAERVVGLQDIVSLDHTCAVDKASAVHCWGTGPFLQDALVAKTTEHTPVKLPIPTATKIGVGADVGCALIENGISCWGSNARGQIAPFESASYSTVLQPRRVEVGDAEIRDLVVGDSSFAILMDGTVVSWGANPPLGRASSLFPDPYPLPTALTGVTMLDLANNNACSTTGGVGYCWGVSVSSKAPALGRALPSPVAAPEPLVQIATTPARDATTPPRWCATAASGNVYCWGNNESGQVGDGTQNHAYQAVKVTGLPGPAALVRTTTNATCALLTTGKVHCWGTNFYGQLGNGKMREASLVPHEVVLP